MKTIVPKLTPEVLRAAAKAARNAIPELLRKGRYEDEMALGEKAKRYDGEADKQDLERT